MASHIAKHLTDSGQEASAEGSTVRLKSGATIEVGDKGDRSYTGASAKVQRTIEQHLREHADKHVRDWASKTSPPPPPPRAVDPAKLAARAKVREAKQAEKAKAQTVKREAREATRAERTAVKEARAKATVEKHAAREAKKAEQLAVLKQIGAPVTKDGKIDAARVPGATKDFTPPTSSDPLHSFKGRSYVARSAKEMASEFLGATGRGGDNEAILTKQLGHTGVRDQTQWEAINEKYETNATTFAEAFAVLAKAAGQGTPNKRPDWRNLDIGALRECAGLEGLEMPAWTHEAELAKQEQEHYSSEYYGDTDRYQPATTYHPPDAYEEAVPF